MLVCDFRVQSCGHRARAVVCLSWLLECFHRRKKGWGARGMRQSHKTDAVGHVTAGAGSASLSVTSPVVGRLECALLPGRGRLPHPGTRRHSWMRLSVLFAELLHVAASVTERCLRRARRLRCGRDRRPHRRRPKCASRQWDSIFDVDMVPPPHTRHPRQPGSQRARAARSGVLGACVFTSGGSPGDHPERNQVHTVSLPKIKK